MSLLTRLLGGLLRTQGQAGSAEAFAARGMEQLAQGRLEAAREEFDRALQRDAGCARAHCGLGVVYQKLGDRSAALHHLQLAARLDADHRVIVPRSAQALDEMGFRDEAIALLEPFAAAHPAEWKASVRLARLLRAREDFDAAIELLERTRAAAPAAGGALQELAGLYSATGRIDDVLATYARIAALHPEAPTAHSVALFYELYREHDRAALAERHRAWGQRFAAPRGDPRFPNPSQAERALRIGYVSADFRNSSAAPFIEPLLSARDAGRFQVVCYHASSKRDAVTKHLASLADGWHDVAALDDDALEARVREDAIDVLVDLNGHTIGNRLTAFARRLAPVQATYLGYGATTGVPAIDYRITDAVIDPPGEAERYYSEQLIRLPDAMWCFTPPPQAPAPASRRAQTEAGVTYGAFNNFTKVSPAVLETWAEILARAPRSRLLLAAVPPGRTRARVLETFAGRGIGPERIVFHGRQSYAEYLALHAAVDIALDTFPYTGGATSCDALWMGVPVLTLAGDSVLARSGCSLLSTLGLNDWIARSPQDYVERALRLGGVEAREALAALQNGLRDRMARSALCDAPRFLRGFEDALRAMWRRWCERA